MVACNPDIKRLNRRSDVPSKRSISIIHDGPSWPETVVSIYREVNLRMAIGQRPNSFWQRVPRSCVLHPLGCPSFVRGIGLRSARCIVLARSLLRRPLFHFTRILNSKISLSLRCPPFLSFLSSFSFSSQETHIHTETQMHEVRLDIIVPIVRRSFQSNAFAVSSRSVE